MTDYLISLGLADEEIIFCYIEYEDFSKYGDYGYCEFNKKPPYELRIKRIEFQEQNEIRVIINTQNCDLIKLLTEKPIRIGSLEDIAIPMEGYPYDGLRIEGTATLERRHDNVE
ncbi:MAG: hypothetical protein FNP40_00265 [Dehalobacter sp. 4CP]|nr:hypothetical protein [Dehalobacter sp. 4CP]